MYQITERFISFEASELPLGISDFPDGRNNAQWEISALGPTLLWVKTKVLQNLDFLTLLEEYRTLVFGKKDKNFQETHKYKRLKQIFDTAMLPIQRVLAEYEILIIERDRSGTKIWITLWTENITIELIDWSSISVNGKKYTSLEEYFENRARKKFYDDSRIEDMWEEPRQLFRIDESLKKKLKIKHPGDYFLYRWSIDIPEWYIAVPADLKQSFLDAHERYKKDGWTVELLNYNFVRTTENRSQFILQTDFDKAILSL